MALFIGLALLRG